MCLGQAEKFYQYQSSVVSLQSSAKTPCWLMRVGLMQELRCFRKQPIQRTQWKRWGL